MKKILGCFFIFYLLIFSGCKKTEPLTQTQIVEKELTANTWDLQTVSVDGVDETSVYAGLSLTFTSTSYSSVNGLGVWPATDTWNFTDDTATSFKRGDGVPVTISQIDQSQLELELSWSTDTFVSGRASSIKGKHIFKFKKK